ncbi:Heme oxygenase [Profundibacterium mesophilum KAUST100406-0324]|uniref:Heme oxygenase n=1 Tax=Profundibacterium mesophilum KAUST100406-0324 TaxID=1037889 RepID=A0A921NRZ2_9RHOB|nr:Heme oxygenase [Profundibacterium mesophilum KAUST100406-0324]
MTGLTTFLAASLRALDAIEPAPGPCRAAAETLRRSMADAARRDLAELGSPAHEPGHGTSEPAASLPRPAALAAEAVLYVLGGARMGAAVLRRDWGRSRDPRVLACGRYLGAQFDGPSWPAVAQALGARPAVGADAEAIVADARRVFHTFERSWPEPGHKKELVRG